MPTATPDDLLAAVDVVVNEYGWSNATTDLIARAAGVNRTTLYRRGYTREQLLAEAALAAAEEFQTASLGPLTASGTACDRMELLLEALYGLADQHLGLLAGLFDATTSMFHMGLDSDDTTMLTRFEYTEPFERLLTDGNIDGTLTSDDPQRDGELIFNVAGWSYIHFRRSHGWTPDTARPAVTQITLGSFRPPPQS